MSKKTFDMPEKCSFCGQSLVNEKTGERIKYVESGGLAGNEYKVWCEKCVEKASKIIGITSVGDGVSKPNTKTAVKSVAKVVLPPGFKVYSPKEMFAMLRQYVVSQEKYLRDVSVWQYNHCRRLQMAVAGVPYEKLPKRNNLLVIGATGTGKTHVMNTLSRIIGLEIEIADVTSMTEAGFVGDEITDPLRRLLNKCGGAVEKMQTSILVLDEVDKLAQKQLSYHHVGAEGVQQSLLKLVSDSDLSTITISASGNKYQPVKRDEVELTTAYMAFAACGAFSGLKSLQRERAGASIGFRRSATVDVDKENVAYTLADDCTLNEDLTKYGIIPELLGRFSSKSILHPLSVDDLEKILTVPRNSIIRNETERFAAEGIELTITPSAIRAMAQNAFNHKLGCRTLVSEFQRVIREVCFETFGVDGDVDQVEVYVNGAGKLATRATGNKLRQRKR